MTGREVDVKAVTENDAAEASGVAHAPELLAFADATVEGSDETLARARDALRAAVGDAGFVDAAAVVGNFERMVRVADGTGIPLDGPLNGLTGDIREDLGIDAFGSAANTPAAGRIARAIGPALRPLAFRLIQLMGRFVPRSDQA